MQVCIIILSQPTVSCIVSSWEYRGKTVTFVTVEVSLSIRILSPICREDIIVPGSLQSWAM